MKTDPNILYTKLQRPPVVPDIVPRQRLYEKLNAGRTGPLTLISAPAGYGKSTLAGLWSAACDGPSGWISLDEGENDLGQFLRYILAAVRSMFPDAVLRSEGLLEATPLPKTAELAQYILNDLHQVSTPFILVLDDYHYIQQASVHDLVAALLKHPAPAMHLVLVTRRDPSLPIATLRGGALLTEIRAFDLRFTSDEVAAFMHRILDVAIDETTADVIEAKTEGWATGLRLAALYLQDSKNLKSRVQALSGNTSHIAEYLISEVLNLQDPEMVSYLLESAILDRFCAPLCRQMHQNKTGKQEVSAEQFIQWLLKNNLFTIGLDDEGHWFRYHHLFQGFLKNQLRNQYRHEQIADLHRIVGRWFAENDLIEEAMEHLLTAGDTPAAVQLVLNHRYALMASSQFVRLNRLIAQLPEKAVEGKPLLVATKAYIGLDLGNDADMYAYTQKALQLLDALSPQSESYLLFKAEVNVMQSFIEMILGEADSGLLHAQDGVKNLPERALLSRSIGIGTLSVCHQMKGNGQDAVAVIRKALANPIWPANLRARIHIYLSIEQYLDADLFGVMNASQECLRAIRDLSFNHTRAFAHYFLGSALYQQNKPAAAESELLKMFENRHVANSSYLAQACFILANIYLSRGDETEARKVFDQMMVYFRENEHPLALSFCRAFEVELALLCGDVQQASSLCRLTDFDTLPPLWYHYTPQLTPIKCIMAQGTEDSLKTAYTQLATWDDRMCRLNRKSARIQIQALLALVCHKQRDEDAALKHLQTALELAEPGGWIRTFLDLGMPLIDLLKVLVQRQPNHAYAQQILEAYQAERSRKAYPEPDATSKPRPNERPPQHSLTPREIEILPLLADGMSNKEIAAKLYISPVTVKTHLQNIFKKLNTKNRIETLRVSRRIGIFHDK